MLYESRLHYHSTKWKAVESVHVYYVSYLKKPLVYIYIYIYIYVCIYICVCVRVCAALNDKFIINITPGQRLLYGL